MPNRQLIEYIKQVRATGKSDAEIKNALFGAGWQEDAVNESFASLLSAVSRSPKIIIAITSVVGALLLAGGGFAYWYFVYESKQTLKSKTEASEIVSTASIVSHFQLRNHDSDIASKKIAENIAQEWKDDAILNTLEITRISLPKEQKQDTYFFSSPSDPTKEFFIVLSPDNVVKEKKEMARRQDDFQYSDKSLDPTNIKISSSEAFGILEKIATNFELPIQKDSFLSMGLAYNDKVGGFQWMTSTAHPSSEKIVFAIIDAETGQVVNQLTKNIDQVGE